MALAFNWANCSDNVTANGGVNTFNVGATNASGANGTINSGDGLLAIVVVCMSSAVDPGTITSPAGWTQIGSINTWFPNSAGDIPYRYAAFVKIAGGAETGSYAFGWTSAANRGASWMLVDYSGENTSTPIDASGAQDNNSSTTSCTAPSISPTGATDILAYFAIDGGTGGALTPPAGMALRKDVGSTSSDRPEIGFADQTLGSSGATGTRVGTNAGGVANSGILIAIQPAAAAGVTTTLGMSQGFLFHPGAGPTFELRGRSAFPDPVVIPPTLPGQIGVPLGYLFRPGSGPGNGIVSARNQAFPDSPPGSGGGGAFQGKEFFSPVGQLM